MAGFSKEYLAMYFQKMSPDFSFDIEFQKLQEGWCSNLSCDGFGNIGILKQNNINYIIFRYDNKNIEKIPYTEFLKMKKQQLILEKI